MFFTKAITSETVQDLIGGTVVLPVINAGVEPLYGETSKEGFQYAYSASYMDQVRQVIAGTGCREMQNDSMGFCNQRTFLFFGKYDLSKFNHLKIKWEFTYTSYISGTSHRVAVGVSPTNTIGNSSQSLADVSAADEFAVKTAKATEPEYLDLDISDYEGEYYVYFECHQTAADASMLDKVRVYDIALVM